MSFLTRLAKATSPEPPTTASTTIVRHRDYSEEEWIEKFTAFLNEQHCSTYGRGFDIHSEHGKRTCAEWLAHAASGAQVL